MGYKEYLENAKKIKITEHFTLYEVAHSDTAIKNNIDNTPNATIIANAVFLIKKVLEPVRIHFNKPVNVNCIYRCSLVNDKVGGAKNSQHLFGQAADIYISGIPNSVIVDFIRKNLDFDQLILEASWVHVSFRLKGNRKQVLKCVNGKYINI
jgi:uncharacterized protein YcbK (DUF882 family)